MRRFYFYYPTEISQTLSRELLSEKPQIGAGKLFYPEVDENIKKIQTVSGISETLMRKFPLSWSHYSLLTHINETFKKEF
jgi:hypothetical protein